MRASSDSTISKAPTAVPTARGRLNQSSETHYGNIHGRLPSQESCGSGEIGSHSAFDGGYRQRGNLDSTQRIGEGRYQTGETPDISNGQRPVDLSRRRLCYRARGRPRDYRRNCFRRGGGLCVVGSTGTGRIIALGGFKEQKVNRNRGSPGGESDCPGQDPARQRPVAADHRSYPGERRPRAACTDVTENDQENWQVMPPVQDIHFREPAARGAEAAKTPRESPSVSEELQDVQGEKMVLNMGPSHPSTHGVLRIVLELDGEIIAKAVPDVGYLHRGDEKIAENMTYTQFIPYTDRLDYLAPLANNVAYALAVEKLMGLDQQLPPRCQFIRVICCELARISAHLLGLGAFAMDVGALTVFMHTFTEREKIYNLCEALTGARFTTSYTRIGGLARDLPPGWAGQCRQFCREVVVNFDESEKLLTRNRIFVDRTRDVGVISKELAIDYGLSGPNLRGSGVEHDLRKAAPYLVYDQLQFDVPVGSVGDCYDRYLVRMEEMRQSVGLLRQCLDRLPGGLENASREPINVPDGKTVLPPKDKVLTSMEELIHQFMLVTQGVNAPSGEVYFGAENPKGELGFYINSKGGGTPHRLKIRAPSFVNLSILPVLLPGHLISDVVSILGSIDFVMGECDR